MYNTVAVFLPIVAVALKIFADLSTPPQNWIDLVSDLGSTGILLVAAYLFISGKIVSAKEKDKQVTLAVTSSRVEFTKSFSKEIREAVKEGIKDAWFEIQEHKEKN